MLIVTFVLSYFISKSVDFKPSNVLNLVPLNDLLFTLMIFTLPVLYLLISIFLMLLSLIFNFFRNVATSYVLVLFLYEYLLSHEESTLTK